MNHPVLPSLLFCLSRSVQKRLTPVLFLTVAVAALLLAATGNAPLALAAGCLALLLVTAMVCAQSWRRHAYKFRDQQHLVLLLARR